MVAGIHEIAVLKISQILRGTTRWSISLIKLKTWFCSFSKDELHHLAKTVEQLFLRKRFCFNTSKGITVLDWFYFSVRPVWSLERVFFDETFSKVWNSLHWLLKKLLFHCTHMSVRCVQAEDCKSCFHETLSTLFIYTFFLIKTKCTLSLVNHLRPAEKAAFRTLRTHQRYWTS